MVERACVGTAGFVGHGFSHAVKGLEINAALQFAEKVHLRRVFAAQALLPVLCFLLLSNRRTAKSGCATDFFRKLFSR